MRKIYFFYISFIVVSLCAFISCTKESIIGKAPIYYDYLVFTKEAPHTISLKNQSEVNTISRCSVGDSVTVFLPVSYVGAYIYRADYDWSLSAAEESQEIQIPTVAPTKQQAPPMWTFKAPSVAGDYQVKFKATYKFSADTELGTIYGESKSFTAKISVR